MSVGPKDRGLNKKGVPLPFKEYQTVPQVASGRIKTSSNPLFPVIHAHRAGLITQKERGMISKITLEHCERYEVPGPMRAPYAQAALRGWLEGRDNFDPTKNSKYVTHLAAVMKKRMIDEWRRQMAGSARGPIPRTRPAPGDDHSEGQRGPALADEPAFRGDVPAGLPEELERLDMKVFQKSDIDPDHFRDGEEAGGRKSGAINHLRDNAWVAGIVYRTAISRIADPAARDAFRMRSGFTQKEIAEKLSRKLARTITQQDVSRIFSRWDPIVAHALDLDAPEESARFRGAAAEALFHSEDWSREAGQRYSMRLLQLTREAREDREGVPPLVDDHLRKVLEECRREPTLEIYRPMMRMRRAAGMRWLEELRLWLRLHGAMADGYERGNRLPGLLAGRSPPGAIS